MTDLPETPTEGSETARSRTLSLEAEIAATPQEIWVALTTSEGLRRWFPLDARVSPGTSGSIWLSWGPGCEGEAPIHIWEPANRFGWTESYGEDDDGQPIKISVDFYIDGRENSTVLRLIQSGFSASADWDETYDALKDGWTYFLFNLDFYFRTHRGKDRHMIWRRVATKLTRDAVWQKLSSVSLVGSGRSNSRETVDILLDRGRTAKVVSERLGHHFTATIPDLDESVLFVEIEGPNVGCWLSTYGLDESIREDLQRALDAQVASLIE